MAEQTINLGRDGYGNRSVVFSRPEIVPFIIAIGSMLLTNQLPGDVIAMLLGFSVAASANAQISHLNEAMALA